MKWPPRIVGLSYRPSVGIMLLNNENRVLIARRIGAKTKAWQMPQGGIDEGETAEIAAMRELKEEIGTDKARILAKTKGPYQYNFPFPLLGRRWGGQYQGQSQIWFLMRFEGQDEDINVHTEYPEFCEWKWAEISELEIIAVSFKRDLYKAIIEEFMPHIYPG